MTTYYPRMAWTSVPRPSSLVKLDPSVVVGVAVHYTGDPKLGQTATLAQSVKRLEAERKFHTDPPPAGRGWYDIAYQVAIDVEGRVWSLRGEEYQSAANGNQTVNRLYGAVTFLIGVADSPTPAMIKAFQDWRYDHWLKRYPHATKIVGHRNLYKTACPGDRTYALITDGTLAQKPQSQPPEEDMPTVDEIVAGIVNYIPPGQALNVATLLHRAYEQAVYNTGAIGDLRNGIDASGLIDAIADAVVARLGSGSGGTLTKDDVKDAVREVLTEGTGGTP